MKTWITTEVYNHADQKLLIQPTPEFDGVEIYLKDTNPTNNSSSEPFFINKEELSVIIKKLQEMMDYVTNK